MEHLEKPLLRESQSNPGEKDTFHHLIALFCTVSGNHSTASHGRNNFCNEINDLEAIQDVLQAENRSKLST
ncbi:MAG: hypothetical protein Q8N17_15660 [Burkholderiaceae bacterium]|nr:hypothetical protein [Burkholderiaceae bacterium]